MSISRSFQCNFCNKFYTSETTLKSHKETNKKCLELQNTTNFTCINCNKGFSTISKLDYHKKKCKVVLAFRIIDTKKN